jgi:GDP-L-fucose synthase
MKPYNLGYGGGITIGEIVDSILKVTGNTPEVIWDETKPDGTPRKLLDVSKMQALGWRHQINLEDGIQKTYDWFLENINDYKELKM